MSFGDDDDILPSKSSHEYTSRADHGKKDELKRKIAKEMGAQKAAKAEKTGLMSKLGLAALKEQLMGKKDSEKKRKEEVDKIAEENPTGTKTLKQKEEALMQTAQDDPDVDTMIERQEKEKEISSEETTPEPG